MKIHVAVLTRLTACIRAEEPYLFNLVFLADGADFITDFVNTEDHRKRPFRYNFFFEPLRFFISSQNSRVVMSSFRSSQKVL